jgi:transmembrane sensor
MENADQLIVNYLAGECPKQEVDKLHRWRQEKPEHEVYFQKLQKLWLQGEISTDTFNPDISQALKAIHYKIDSKESHKLPRESSSRDLFYYSKRIAATVIILVATGLGYFFFKPLSTGVITVQTLTSGKKEILLPDGSKVWLNVNSTLQFPEEYAAETREVYLEGEAYFDIAKDPVKPFIIHTDRSATQVIGTSFNIRAFPEEEKTTVTVMSGKVSFFRASHPDLKIFLIKGDKGILNNDSNLAVRETNADPNFLSWKTGKILFDDTPFAIVAETLSRHYQKEIRIEKTLSNCRFTSTFENPTLDNILEELVLLQNITIKRTGDVIILSGKGC